MIKSLLTLHHEYALISALNIINLTFVDFSYSYYVVDSNLIEVGCADDKILDQTL